MAHKSRREGAKALAEVVCRHCFMLQPEIKNKKQCSSCGRGPDFRYVGAGESSVREEVVTDDQVSA